MSLLLSFQAELGSLANGATIISDSDCTVTGSPDNAVLISAGPENFNYIFGSIPSGATKFKIFLKKSTANSTTSSINVNILGGATAQYGAFNQTLTTEGLHPIEVTTMPNSGNDTINIDGSGIIIDRFEWHNDSSSSITINNETLATVSAGTFANAISLTAPTVVNCADQNSRKVTAIGVGITLKKGAVTMSVNDTFSTTDSLTYDIASSVAATTAYQIFNYKAVGACGDSNEATISANVTASVSGSISISDATLPNIVAGQTGVSVTFVAPVTNNCADTGNRKLIDSNVVVKKNGIIIGQDAMFTSTDVITFDVPSTVTAQTAFNVLTYKAYGACGDSNQAILYANVTGSSSGSITISDATLPSIVAGQTGVGVTFVAPVTNNCTDTGNRTLIDSNVIVKKNGTIIGQGATFTSTDVITFDVPSTVTSQTAFNVLTYKVSGSCGESNQAVLYADVTSGGSTLISVVNQTLSSKASNSIGNTFALTAPNVSSTCTFTGTRKLTAISAGVTIWKNGTALTVGSSWLSTDAVTFDIAQTITAQTAKTLFGYKAVGTCGDSNEAIVSADITAGATTNSISIVGQTISSITVATSGNTLVVLTAPTLNGSCTFTGVRKLTAITTGVTIKKNNVAMIVGTTWTASDIITYDLASTITVQNGKELFRYLAVGSCGDSNEAIILGNIIAVPSPSGGGGIVYTTPTQSPILTASSGNQSSMSVWMYLLIAFFIGIFSFLFFFLFGRRKKKDDKKKKK
jgi:hypothetical protein